MSVRLALKSELTEDRLHLTLGISNQGGNAAMALWKVQLPDGLVLEQPYEPLEGTKDLAESVDAEIGRWTIDLSRLSGDQRSSLEAKSAKVVGSVTGDGDTYEIGDTKEFKELLGR